MVKAVMAAVILALVSPAAAQAPAEQVETLAAKAKAHYKAGRFNDAISVYLEAYQVSPAAGLLYNVAHIYDRKLDELDLALQFYRRYVGDPTASPEGVRKANLRIQELKAEKKKREVAAMARPKPPVAQPPPPVVTKPIRPTSNKQKTAGWVAIGVGVAAAGAGAVFGIQAQGSADDFDSANDLTTKKNARDDGQSQALLADILYGVGAVSAITGVVLLLTADDDDATAWQLGPTSDGTGAAVYWGGSL